MRSPLHRLRAAAELLAASPENIANDPAEIAKLLADDGKMYSMFGESVALSADGRIALIGSKNISKINEEDDWVDESAYFFVRNSEGGWSQQEKLTSMEGFGSFSFGRSVALSADGNTALVGAKGKFVVSGGVLDVLRGGIAVLFTKDGDGIWRQQVTLVNPKGGKEEFSEFGYSMSLSADGKTALIGDRAVYKRDADINTHGSAYIFVKGVDETWRQQVEFVADDNTKGDRFGYSVSLSADGQTALIGGESTQSAYVFIKGEDGSWGQQAKLTVEHIKAFGRTVSLSADGRTALISAGDGDGKSSVYVFIKGEDGSWGQQAKLTADDGEAGDAFVPRSLSADGRIALIGASGDDDRVNNSGAAYVFVKNEDGTWHQRFKLTAEDGEAEDHFGMSGSLSADGQTALIGAPHRGEYTGSAYVFSIPPLGSPAPVAAVRLRQ